MKKNFLKTLLLSLILYNPALFASQPYDEDTKKELDRIIQKSFDISNTAQVKPDSVFEITQKIWAEWEDLQKANSPQQFSIGDREHIFYHTHFSFSKYYEAKAAKEVEINKIIFSLNQSLDYFNKYYSEFKDVKPTTDKFKKILNVHLMSMEWLAGEILNKLARQFMQGNSEDKCLKESLIKCAVYRETSLKRYKNSFLYNSSTVGNYYFFLARIYLELSALGIKDFKEITNSPYYESYNKYKTQLNGFPEYYLKLVGFETSLKSDFSNFTYSKKDILATPISVNQELAKRCENEMSPQKDVIERICLRFATLTHLTFGLENFGSYKGKNHKSRPGYKLKLEEILQGLKELESMVSESLKNSPGSSADHQVNTTTLEGTVHFYKTLKNIVGEKIFDNRAVILDHALFFLNDGKPEDALLRIDALLHLEKEWTGEISEKAKMIHLAIRLLNGQAEAYQELMDKVKPLLEAKQSKSQRRKERKRQARAGQIKTYQAEVDALKRAAEEEKLQKQNEQETKVLERKEIREGKERLPSDPNLLEVTPYAPTSELKKLKRKERIKAYEESQRPYAYLQQIKEEKGSSSSAPSISEEKILSVPQPLAPPVVAPEEPIAYHYLNGVAWDVHDSIEKGINGGSQKKAGWKFTRDDLQKYFEALGCTTRKDRGKGVHEESLYPDALVVEKNGQILALFADFNLGGAIPLPSWKGNDVPLYLRKQILSARAKLKATNEFIRTGQPQASDPVLRGAQKAPEAKKKAKKKRGNRK